MSNYLKVEAQEAIKHLLKMGRSQRWIARELDGQAIGRKASGLKVYHFADRESGPAEPRKSIAGEGRKAVGFGFERPVRKSALLEGLAV